MLLWISIKQRISRQTQTLSAALMKGALVVLLGMLPSFANAITATVVSDASGIVDLAWTSALYSPFGSAPVTVSIDYAGSGTAASYPTYSTRISGLQAGTYAFTIRACGQYGTLPAGGCRTETSNTVFIGGSAPVVENFSADKVQSFLDKARSENHELVEFLNEALDQKLSEAHLVLDRKGLAYSDYLPDYEIRGGCTANVKAINLRAYAHISSESEFKLMMQSLSKPIVASLQLVGDVGIDGAIRTRLGARILGKCIRYARLTIDVGAKTDFTVDTNLEIYLNPTKDTSEPGVLKIKFDPQLKLSGGMSLYTQAYAKLGSNGGIAKIPVVGDIVSNSMNFLLKQVVNYGTDRLNSDMVGKVNTAFNQYLATEQASLQYKLRETIPAQFVVAVSSEHENQMLSFVSHYAVRYLPPYEFLKANGPDIIYSLLTGDEDMLKAKISTAAACNLSADILSVNMPTTATPADFKVTSRTEFCSKVDKPDWLGNAEPGISGYTGQEPWTLTPGTRVDISTVSSIKGNTQPYTKRVNYRTITGISDGVTAQVNGTAYNIAMASCYSAGRGTCANPPNIAYFTAYTPIPRGTGSCKLEMRIYKKDVAQTGLKPLLAIHGGAWKYRGAAWYGLESQISHFTDQGFVVFAPFYRLTGDVDGNIECNNATGKDIVTDIEAALEWVKSNKNAYGATAPTKVHLFGQSAGAHLAGWLVTHKPADIQKAFLMYPPTDAQDYIKQYSDFKAGRPYSNDYEGSLAGLGASSMQAYFAVSKLENMDVYDSQVLANSYPGIISSNPSAYPPIFSVHGRADRLVPSIQSVRLCNAYAGSPDSGPATNADSPVKQIYNCGPSTLHILQEADHMIELCLPPLRCEAGESTAAIDAARESLAQARQWLAQ